MFNNMNLFKYLYAVFSLLILSMINPVLAQEVESISAEVLNDVSADELYWVVEVTCEGIDGSRSMQQRAGESTWCAVDLPQMCEASKRPLAEQLCGPEFQSLARPDVPESTGVDATQERVSQVPVAAPPVTRSEPDPVIQTPEVSTTEPVVEPRNVVESVPVQPSQQESNFTSSAVNATTSSAPSTIDSSAITADETLMTAEEIAIEEELIQLEQQMLELRLQEIELE